VGFIIRSSNSTNCAFNYSYDIITTCLRTDYCNTWGSRGSGNGQFDSPSGIDLDFRGNVYVVDTGNNRIQKLNATDGKFITKWGSSGSGPGQFVIPTGIAVDLKTGSVYPRWQIYYVLGLSW
jgi:DNA-binding beta-propeller fold protein YncE